MRVVIASNNPGKLRELNALLWPLGFHAAPQSEFTAASAEETGDAEAERLLAEREEARTARDFERADHLRDELAELGWEVRDGPEGARLVRRA